MSIKKIQPQHVIEAKLARWKKEYGDDASFITLEGFPVNVFDDVWVLNGTGNSGYKLYLSYMHDINWEGNSQCHVRLVLGELSTKRAAGTVDTYLSLLRKSLITNFTQPQIEQVWGLLSNGNKCSLKSLLKELKRLDKAQYEDAYSWVTKNHASQASKANHYDIEAGAFTIFERQSVEREFGNAMSDGLSTLERNRNNFDVLLKSVLRMRCLVTLRLNYILSRRISNLHQSKWNDFLPVGASFKGHEDEIVHLTFSDEDELQVRIWKSKNKSGFRESVEKFARRLNVELSREMISYRKAFRHLLHLRLIALNIDVSDIELDTLVMRSPIYFTTSLFKTEFTNKSELFMAFSENGTGFHENQHLISGGISNLCKKMSFKSDRVPRLKVSNNRFRHTVGTNAAILGFDAIRIADLLGNTQSAAKRYIDMTDEQRVNINNKFIANDQLKLMFNVDITTLQKDKRYTISDDFGNEAGQVKNRRSCGKCEETRPIGCYGCNNFQALEDGDHQNIRDIAQQKYDARIALGEPELILAKLATQIKWIEVTIAICNERIAKRNSLN